MTKTIFVSHIAEERELAFALKDAILADFGDSVDMFVSSDLASIRAGRQWLTAISEALKRADIMIVLCSHESTTRPWIQFESGAAWVKEIPLIPACHTGLIPSELPVPLASMQAVDLGTAEGVERLYLALAEIIGSPAPASRAREAHERLLTVSAHLEDFRERRAKFERRQLVTAWLAIVAASCAISTVYAAALYFTGGEDAIAGGVLELAGPVLSIFAGAAFRVRRHAFELELAVVAALVLGTLCGVLSMGVYWQLAGSPDMDFYSKNFISILKFFAFIIIGFFAGIGLSSWLLALRRDPRDHQLADRVLSILGAPPASA